MDAFTGVTTICTALAVLTPLVKAVSDWHIKWIKVRRAKPTAHQSTGIDDKRSMEIKAERPGIIFWLNVVMFICFTTVGIAGLVDLVTLQKYHESLTVAIAARLAIDAMGGTVMLLKVYSFNREQ